MAMATGRATLRYVKENQLPNHVEKIGSYLKKQLHSLQREMSSIGDIRGRGLMLGIEIINPTKHSNHLGSFPAYPELASLIQQECFKRGLILEVGGRFSTVIRLLPPLIITKEQIDDVLQRFNEAIKSAETQLGLRLR
jgi:diaminobutyrate-2-oxoglutarate transaminase